MKFVTVSELRLKATQLVKEIEEDRKEVIVTINGHPVVLMKPITDNAFMLKEKEVNMEYGKRNLQKG